MHVLIGAPITFDILGPNSYQLVSAVQGSHMHALEDHIGIIYTRIFIMKRIERSPFAVCCLAYTARS